MKYFIIRAKALARDCILLLFIAIVALATLGAGVSFAILAFAWMVRVLGSETGY
jgi:hypothetical protein